MQITLKSIAYGKAQTYTFGEKVFESAYKKDQFVETIEVNYLGLLHDKQVDKRFHGGIDKAIHFGSSKHLEANPKLDKLFMGCNIFVDGVDEHDIFVGDVFRIGEVVVEVCQPRFPCWKIGALFGKEANRYIKEHSATGWYVRILKEGVMNLSDKMILEKRVSSMTIANLSSYTKTIPSERTLIDEIVNSQVIAQAYKNDFLFTLQNNNS